ncbi:MAG TPA: universal stress protein [Rhizomicrobium sp.]
MYRTILVPGLIPVCDPQAMDLATRLARHLGAGRIEYLHVHPDARELARHTASLDLQSAAFAGQVWDALVEGDKTCTTRSRKSFDTFCARDTLTGEGAVSAAFRECDGNAGDCAVAEARYADLVVLGRPGAPEDLTAGAAGEVLVESGRPVLLTPSQACANPLSTVAIAWKQSAAAAHAAAAAMPLLKKAQRIHIVSVAESGEEEEARRAAERLAAALSRHGLHPNAVTLRAGGRAASDVLLEAAAQTLEAGVLVMGGYGHSRARELVFGGVTRAVLRAAPLPVLLAH